MSSLRFGSVFSSLAILVACSGSENRAPERPHAGEATFSVLTYNVNFGLAGDAETLGAVDERADLIVLEETTPEWETSFRERFSATHPQIAFRHCCRAGGLGIVSKYPFEDAEYIEPPERGWFPAWRFTVDSPIGKVQVLAVHLRPQIGDNGGVVSGYFSTPRVREAEIEKYFAHLEAGIPTIIAGDFNEQPGGRALEFLGEHGFKCALEEFDGPHDTWRWPTSFGTLHRNFDHIVYGHGLRALSAEVRDAGRSDHVPVLGVFARG